MSVTTESTKLRRLKRNYTLMQKMVDERTDQLAQSNKKLQSEIIQRKRIESEILEITQEEQRRFGSQLHDGLCQELTAISIFAKSLAQKMEINNTLELAELKKISDMLLIAVDQARDTARGLYPGELEGVSLMHSLEELTFLKLGNYQCTFYCPSPILVKDSNTATHLYRIAQEGISNAALHGKSKNIEVSFTQDKNNITLTITDDGIGMMSNLKNLKGIGLKIMKYRAHLINASFQIKPNSPHGVIISCMLNNTKIKRKHR